MKIEVGSYTVCHKGKNSSYLDIEIKIELPDGQIMNTGATLGLYPIGYFFDRNPKQSEAFLYFSAIVYAIDRSVERKRYSVDGWSREFEVVFTLPKAEKFSQEKQLIDHMLGYLTGDYWDCEFCECELPTVTPYEDSEYFKDITQVNLFSGGMDSLIGAIDFMASSKGGKVFLASHYDSDMNGPKSDQSRLLKCFKEKYNNRYVVLPKNSAVLIKSKASSETTCRSRSLMFISIALQVAIYTNVDIILPENGSVSLNYPLSDSRRSSCSTRTTHPVLLRYIRQLLSAMDMPTGITNPYEFLTKGEMVQNCLDKDYLLEINQHSNSCGKGKRRQFFYDVPSATHCGRCMPCMYRKAALADCQDLTEYGISINSLFTNKGKISDDFFAMLNFLKKDLCDSDIRRELRIAGLGQLPDFENYVDLVKRTRLELKRMIIKEGSTAVKQYIDVL